MKRTPLKIFWDAVTKVFYADADEDDDLLYPLNGRLGKETISCGDAVTIDLTEAQSRLAYLRVIGSNDNSCRINFHPPPNNDGVLPPVWIENQTDDSLTIGIIGGGGTTALVQEKLDDDNALPGSTNIFRFGVIISGEGAVPCPGYSNNT